MLHYFWETLKDWFYENEINLLYLTVGISWGILISTVILILYKHLL